MRYRRFIGILIFSLSILFLSCKQEGESCRISMDNSFYWALCPDSEAHPAIESSVNDAEKLEYYKLEKMEFRNLFDLVGGSGKVIWLKAEFILPDELKNQDLSMVIPYLHFADELYLNGIYIDDYGFMDYEELQDAGYTAHLFDFPEFFLNQDGVNTIYMKVYALGFATISNGVFISNRQNGWAQSDIQSFWQSRIYLPFEGGMLSALIIFLILFISSKKEKIYLLFAGINLFSIEFFASFFAGDLPFVGFHGGIPYFIFVKITRCISFFGMEFIAVLFIFEFLRLKHHKIAVIMRILCSSFCIIYTIFAPDYFSLMKACPILLGISAIDLILAFFTIIGNLFYAQKRKLALYLLIGASPLIFTMIFDFIAKVLVRNITLPYFSMLGWQGTIIFFFIYFSVQYRRLSVRLEYLNTELENEVEIQTRQLSIANEKLDSEMKIAQADIQTAAIVQQKLFHPPEREFPHWDIAVCYRPLSYVSGDFYNFYSMGNELYGVSLFDASGHGVAASLITMLAENIIQQNFRESNIYGEDISVTLERINANFIAAKGDVENYMTGLLLNIRETEGKCQISLIDAAHPYPELYHSEEAFPEEILPDAENPSFGPIGMDLIDVHYAPLVLELKKNDVLVLFTDGLVEAMNENREEYGRKALEKILKGSEEKSAQEILREIQESLDSFVGSAARTDDVTIIVMKRK